MSYYATYRANDDHDGARGYSYDSHDRLYTGAFDYTDEGMTDIAATYGYDTAGNHTGSFHGETLTEADYDRSNQRVGEEYAYTAEGDPTIYKGFDLAFDVEHHLTSYDDGQNPSLSAATGRMICA